MTLVLMGEKPPVMNAEMLSHSPCRNARNGSMPVTSSTRKIGTSAHRITVTAMRAMKRVVCTTFGTTCSLRPSDAYKLASLERLPNRPSESATTTNPMPPTKCMTKRNMLSATDIWSIFVTQVAPVVVRPDTQSNSASV